MKTYNCEYHVIYKDTTLDGSIKISANNYLRAKKILLHCIFDFLFHHAGLNICKDDIIIDKIDCDGLYLLNVAVEKFLSDIPDI